MPSNGFRGLDRDLLFNISDGHSTSVATIQGRQARRPLEGQKIQETLQVFHEYKCPHTHDTQTQERSHKNTHSKTFGVGQLSVFYLSSLCLHVVPYIRISSTICIPNTSAILYIYIIFRSAICIRNTLAIFMCCNILGCLILLHTRASGVCVCVCVCVCLCVCVYPPSHPRLSHIILLYMCVLIHMY